MAISVNEGGKMFELDEVWVKEGNTLIELDEVWANEGVNLVQIHSSFKPPDVISWTAQSSGRLISVTNNGYTVKFSGNNLNVYGISCVSNEMYLKAGTKISAKVTAVSGSGAYHETFLSIYIDYNNDNRLVMLSKSKLGYMESNGENIYSITESGYYQLGLHARNFDHDGTNEYTGYEATSTVEITISK